MTIKNKVLDVVMGAVLIAGRYIEKWLEQPEIDAQTDADKRYTADAERKRKRKEAFRAAQSDAFKAKHPTDSRQPEFTVDCGQRRRHTDIHD